MDWSAYYEQQAVAAAAKKKKEAVATPPEEDGRGAIANAGGAAANAKLGLVWVNHIKELREQQEILREQLNILNESVDTEEPYEIRQKKKKALEVAIDNIDKYIEDLLKDNRIMLAVSKHMGKNFLPSQGGGRRRSTRSHSRKQRLSRRAKSARAARRTRTR